MASILLQRPAWISKLVEEKSQFCRKFLCEQVVLSDSSLLDLHALIPPDASTLIDQPAQDAPNNCKNAQIIKLLSKQSSTSSTCPWEFEVSDGRHYVKAIFSASSIENSLKNYRNVESMSGCLFALVNLQSYRLVLLHTPALNSVSAKLFVDKFQIISTDLRATLGDPLYVTHGPGITNLIHTRFLSCADSANESQALKENTLEDASGLGLLLNNFTQTQQITAPAGDDTLAVHESSIPDNKYPSQETGLSADEINFAAFETNMLALAQSSEKFYAHAIEMEYATLLDLSTLNTCEELGMDINQLSPPSVKASPVNEEPDQFPESELIFQSGTVENPDLHDLVADSETADSSHSNEGSYVSKYECSGKIITTNDNFLNEISQIEIMHIENEMQNPVNSFVNPSNISAPSSPVSSTFPLLNINDTEIPSRKRKLDIILPEPKTKLSEYVVINENVIQRVLQRWKKQKQNSTPQKRRRLVPSSSLSEPRPSGANIIKSKMSHTSNSSQDLNSLTSEKPSGRLLKSLIPSFSFGISQKLNSPCSSQMSPLKFSRHISLNRSPSKRLLDSLTEPFSPLKSKLFSPNNPSTIPLSSSKKSPPKRLFECLVNESLFSKSPFHIPDSLSQKSSPRLNTRKFGAPVFLSKSPMPSPQAEKIDFQDGCIEDDIKSSLQDTENSTFLPNAQVYHEESSKLEFKSSCKTQSLISQDLIRRPFRMDNGFDTTSESSNDDAIELKGSRCEELIKNQFDVDHAPSVLLGGHNVRISIPDHSPKSNGERTVIFGLETQMHDVKSDLSLKNSEHTDAQFDEDFGKPVPISDISATPKSPRCDENEDYIRRTPQKRYRIVIEDSQELISPQKTSKSPQIRPENSEELIKNKSDLSLCLDRQISSDVAEKPFDLHVLNLLALKYGKDKTKLELCLEFYNEKETFRMKKCKIDS